MSTITMSSLIHQARTELGSDACQSGKHTWESEGGRGCPHELLENCSQAVYLCSVCGTYDYGDPGGPGEADCESHCPNQFSRACAIAKLVKDPLDNWWPGTGRAITNGIIFHTKRLRALRRQCKPRLP